MEIGRLFGLPAHPLLVHAVVVLVPLCSLGVAVGALWPAARGRLAWVLLGLTIVTVAMVPLATGSGEVLEEMVKENGLVERHAELGDDYLPYAFALLIGAFAVAGLQWIEGGRQGRSALVPVIREIDPGGGMHRAGWSSWSPLLRSSVLLRLPSRW
jgi:hypothetical protein